MHMIDKSNIEETKSFESKPGFKMRPEAWLRLSISEILNESTHCIPVFSLIELRRKFFSILKFE